MSQEKSDLIINAIVAAITKKPNMEFQQGILIKKEILDLSQGKSDLIINTIVAAITKKPNMEFQQGKKRIDKQQDIQFKNIKQAWTE